jgi:hypothetical protein
MLEAAAPPCQASTRIHSAPSARGGIEAYGGHRPVEEDVEPGAQEDQHAAERRVPALEQLERGARALAAGAEQHGRVPESTMPPRPARMKKWEVLANGPASRPSSMWGSRSTR